MLINNITNLFINNNIFQSYQYTSMEDLISHFINWHTRYDNYSRRNTIYIEAPKGEFGVNLISNNTVFLLDVKYDPPVITIFNFCQNYLKDII